MSGENTIVYCILLLTCFIPFNNRETHMICCVVLLNMNVLWLISCSDIDGHFQSFDVSNNTVRSSSSIPPCTQAWVFLRVDTKKWNCWVIGGRTWSFSYILPCCPPEKCKSSNTWVREYLFVHILFNTQYSKLGSFRQLPLICHVFTVTHWDFNRYNGFLASVSLTFVGLMLLGVTGSKTQYNFVEKYNVLNYSCHEAAEDT